MTTEEARANLEAARANFNEKTKKRFGSCTFAALNTYGPRADWQAWGDFENPRQALAAARMWATAFGGKVDIRIVGGAYRVSVGIAEAHNA
jgi:hypothetical protein